MDGEHAERDQLSDAPWWRSAVVYQIYPRSFLDTDGNGVGDLPGIERRLDYLRWLGVDALWLSPIYPSPMADFGYDVADYCDIDQLFGSLDDFDALLEKAHERGLRVLLDWVPNHTSDQHRWFQASRSAREDPQRDWYIWRDEPNNWVQAFADESAWTYDEVTGQHYLHLFLPEQPDLNWNNPDVERAMHEVLRFWLDRGVDGFRADVVHLIGKNPELEDDPSEVAGTSRVSRHDEPVTHGLLRRLRGVLESYEGDRMMVGEVNLEAHEQIVDYYGAGDELHLAFNFVPLWTDWKASGWRSVIAEMERVYQEAGAWPTWVLSNHDVPRHRTRYGSLRRARAAALLVLTLRGTPFLYAGEEWGLEDAEVPPERVVDPGGRDGCRAPLPWDATPDHGWASADPWLPWPPEAATRNAASLREDGDSILHLYRRLLTARKKSPALSGGTFTPLDTAAEDVLGYRRRHDTDERVVLVNFSDRPISQKLEGGWQVEVSSGGADGRHGEPYDGALQPEEAVLLRPDRG